MWSEPESCSWTRNSNRTIRDSIVYSLLVPKLAFRVNVMASGKLPLLRELAAVIQTLRW